MHTFIKLFIYTFVFFAFLKSHAQQAKDSKDSGKKLYGEASLTSNHVENGVTQSDKTWAIQSGFGVKLGQVVRVGVWGSSVKFPSNQETVNLRPYIDVKMDFTANAFATAKYHLNRYFASSDRDGTIIAVDINMFGYQVLYANNDNWEGTRASSTWYGFRKEFGLPQGLILTPTIGYSQLAANGATNYFDTRVTLGYKLSDALFELTHTYTSASAQFQGRADMALFLALSVKF